MLCIFVDSKGAFDYLRCDKVLGRLREVNCPEFNLWATFFSQRRACAVGSIDIIYRDVVRGCSQESIWGPYIWIFMMNPLLRRLDDICKFSAYANDLFIPFEGRSRAVLQQLGERTAYMFAGWEQCGGASVSLEKTMMMILKAVSWSTFTD